MRARIVMLGVLVWASACGSAEEDDALRALIEFVLEPSGLGEDDVVVHRVGTLEPGTEVQPALAEEPDPTEVEEATTLFLVDQDAGARWGHDVDWAWVGEDGSVALEGHTSFPLVNGEGYLPSLHAPVWGTPVVEVPTERLEDPSWASGVLLPPEDDDCDPDKPSLALGIGGTRGAGAIPQMRAFGELVDGRYEAAAVLWEPTLDDIDARLSALSGPDDAWDELLVVIAAHYADWGKIVLGDDENAVAVGPLELVGVLSQVKADRVTIVLDICSAGRIARRLPDDFKTFGVDETEVFVLAASGADESSWVSDGPAGTTFGDAVYDSLRDTDLAEDLPWQSLDLPRLVTDHPDGPKAQTPETATLERCIPEITLQSNPTEAGACQAGWLDMTEGDDATPSRDYGREIRLRGSFGSGTGRVELQQALGNWVTVPHVFWSDDVVLFQMPMRRDGFPASGFSPDLGVLEAPADARVEDGKYLVRVVNAEEATSAPQAVKVVPQVYEMAPFAIEPTAEWFEQWHPFTPPALYTQGPTILLSVTWSPDLGDDPLDEEGLAFDHVDDAPHITDLALAAAGNWTYDLAPGVLDPATAYADAAGFSYFGYRVRFADEPDNAQSQQWRFTLVYD